MEVVLEIENKLFIIFYIIINKLITYSTPGAAPYEAPQGGPFLFLLNPSERVNVQSSQKPAHAQRRAAPPIGYLCILSGRTLSRHRAQFIGGLAGLIMCGRHGIQMDIYSLSITFKRILIGATIVPV